MVNKKSVDIPLESSFSGINPMLLMIAATSPLEFPPGKKVKTRVQLL
jgi:hypothetical protein